MRRARALTFGLVLATLGSLGHAWRADAQVPVSPDSATPEQTTPATPANSALEAQTTALASELRCPVCQGLSIQDSPSELAQDMRDVIREQLRSGKSPDEVRQYFLDKYGEWILLEPKPQGFNLLVYALPIAALLGGAAIVWRTVRRFTAPVPAEPPPAPDVRDA